MRPSGVPCRDSQTFLSEVEVVRQLIAALAGQPVVFTLDALHCQKKRLSRLPNNSSTIQFLQPIQQHWNIENRLHWVRDVTFEEDHARPGAMLL